MYKDDLLVGKNAECTLKGESYVILSYSLLVYRDFKVKESSFIMEI